MSEDVKIAACPFCGETKRVWPQNGNIGSSENGWHQLIWCENCGATSREWPTEAEAIAAWNRRPAIEPVPAPSGVDALDLKYDDDDMEIATSSAFQDGYEHGLKSALTPLTQEPEPIGLVPDLYITEDGTALAGNPSRLQQMFRDLPEPPVGQKTIALFATPIQAEPATGWVHEHTPEELANLYGGEIAERYQVAASGVVKLIMQQAIEHDRRTASPTPPVENVGEVTGYPTLEEAYATALTAAQMFEDAANVEETNWTGWGEQTVPFNATMRRVKAEQAVRALKDADRPMATLSLTMKGEK